MGNAFETSIEDVLQANRSEENGLSISSPGGKKGKQMRIEFLRETSLRKKRMTVTNNRRAIREKFRTVEREGLHTARWQNFLLNGTYQERALNISLIVSNRAVEPPTTPEKLNQDVETLHNKLKSFVRGSCFPDEIPNGVEVKVQAIKTQALTEWKNLRHNTAVIDKPASQKANALQDSDRQLQIERQQNIRRFKQHRRMQRLQHRIRGLKDVIKRLNESIQSDPELLALIKQ